VRNCDDPDPKNHKLFEQPVIQTAQMFVGEMGTWIFVAIFSLRRRYFINGSAPNAADYEPVSTVDEYLPEHDDSSVMSTTPMNPVGKPHSVKEARIPLTGWRVLLLSLPAICDILGTTLMNVGLLFVVASIYQMTRGALVLFVGLFSVLFLRKRLHLFQWFALVTVVLGVGVVGLAGAIYKDPKAAPSAALAAREAIITLTKRAKSPEALRTILGIFLIAGAQIFTASQFVFEEYILEKYELQPLKVVGWEGIFGFSFTTIAMIVLHLTIGRTEAGRYGYFDLVEAWREITHYRSIAVSSFLIMISIGYDPPSLPFSSPPFFSYEKALT
jgi:drug/metabolite transporter (DMT)-like permease